MKPMASTGKKQVYSEKKIRKEKKRGGSSKTFTWHLVGARGVTFGGKSMTSLFRASTIRSQRNRTQRRDRRSRASTWTRWRRWWNRRAWAWGTHRGGARQTPRATSGRAGTASASGAAWARRRAAGWGRERAGRWRPGHRARQWAETTGRRRSASRMEGEKGELQLALTSIQIGWGDLAEEAARRGEDGRERIWLEL